MMRVAWCPSRESSIVRGHRRNGRMLTSQRIDTLPSGTIVGGKYKLLERIGEGGFATVYLAQHTEVASLRAALKVLHAEHAESASNRKRFRREAEMAAGLQSRFIVRVLDAGELPDGRPFIAMEYVDGVPLDQLLKRTGRLAPRDVARFAEGILRALDVAHSAGIVHRDLKPDNVFAVEEDGEPPYGRVLDFGIAKVIEGGVAPGTHTIAGSVVCTPQYAAPDLLNGQVTPLIDLYALGHVMAELLEGYAPYQTGAHPLTVAAEHLKPEPVPLGPYTRRSGLESVVARACAKPVSERYQSARQMLVAVRAAIPSLYEESTARTLTLASPYELSVDEDVITQWNASVQPPRTTADDPEPAVAPNVTPGAAATGSLSQPVPVFDGSRTVGRLVRSEVGVDRKGRRKLMIVAALLLTFLVVAAVVLRSLLVSPTDGGAVAKPSPGVDVTGGAAKEPGTEPQGQVPSEGGAPADGTEGVAALPPILVGDGSGEPAEGSGTVESDPATAPMDVATAVGAAGDVVPMRDAPERDRDDGSSRDERRRRDSNDRGANDDDEEAAEARDSDYRLLGTTPESPSEQHDVADRPSTRRPRTEPATDRPSTRTRPRPRSEPIDPDDTTNDDRQDLDAEPEPPSDPFGNIAPL